MARTGKIYQQLMDSIRNKILSGELKLNEKLESIQRAMEDEMRRYTIEDLHEGMEKLLAEEA